jgi:multicomponent Na+:H+ antiporter subunit G
MNDLVATIAVILGTILCVLSAVGVVRMPDVYTRLQVASKASSLGIALLVVGVAAHFDSLSVTIRALLVVVFLFLTAPVAAHVIGRAAYITGVPLAAGTDQDELAGAYDASTGHLAGEEHLDEAQDAENAGQPAGEEHVDLVGIDHEAHAGDAAGGAGAGDREG